MTLQEALEKIKAPARGMSTVIEAMLGGDRNSILGHSADAIQAAGGLTEDYVTGKILKFTRAVRDCQSDAAYWGYLGDLEYWKGVRDLLEADKITGGNLPDVSGPADGVIVMDAIASKRKWCAAVLKAAKGDK